MALSIIVEDGSIVADANSYISEANAVVYADNWLLDIGDDSDKRKRNLINAARYLNTKIYNGVRSNQAQSMQHPRNGMYVNNVLIAPDVIHKTIPDAQVELAAEFEKGDIYQSSNNDGATDVKIDVIEWSYGDSGQSASARSMPKANAMIEDLIKKGLCRKI